jgi:peptidoglycan/xylan/chitin deacetylase (PgdA/CDA1 family)
VSCNAPRTPLRALCTLALCAGCASTKTEGSAGNEARALSSYMDAVAWSDQPPGLAPVDVPQFVAVTFDDNFVSGLGDPSGAMTWATDFFRSLNNPAGSAIAGTFDGAAVRTSFFNNCVYLEHENTRLAWTTAFEDGHEIANHTINHPHGGAFLEQNWTDEIGPCTAALSNAETGVGVSVDDVRGFRSPYLEYNEALFPALKGQGLEYDTSVSSCWADGDDGSSCAWPYTLDSGSLDAESMTAKFATPSVPAAPGLWEVTTSALFVPPDELATEYGFAPGLRQRIPTDMPAPSFYEASTGRIAPLDITLFVDAGMTATEVLATLEYTLDQRLAGNRAPFVFVAHTHVYASNYGAAANALDASERQAAIEDFIGYALSKSVVRMRPVKDILSWMREPVPLNGVVTMPIDAGASGGSAGTGADAGLGGSAGAAGAAGMPAGGGSAGTTGVAGEAGAAAPSPSASGCSCGMVGHELRSWPALFVAGALAFALSRRRQ